MHIANIGRTIFKQVYDFPFVLSHKTIGQDVGPKASVEHDLHHWRRLEPADSKGWIIDREMIHEIKAYILLPAFHSHLSTEERGLGGVDFVASLSAT